MMRYLLLTLLTCSTTILFAQNNPRPSKSRFWLNKHATFQIKGGDVLVYQVKSGQEQYELLVTIKQNTNGLTFDYSVPEKDKQGTVQIPATSLKSGSAYQNMFTTTANGSVSNNNNKGMLWLSQDNYRQLAAKSGGYTKMDMGNGIETFKRTGGSVQKINYKGKEKICTVYKIAGTASTGTKEFSVLTDLTNPLIINWDGNETITLKEVR